MGANSTKTEQKYSVDQMMQNVALFLVRDFQRNLDDPTIFRHFRDVVKSGCVRSIREVEMVPDSTASVAEFKATYQLQSLFKRYRFDKDLYSDDELTAKAISGFRETQTRIENTVLHDLPRNMQVVLDMASVYIAHVLGEYSDEEHRSRCRFGKRASIGIPAKAACEAARWEIPVTGSLEQIEWFDSEMSEVGCVQDYWAKQQDSDLRRSIYQPVSSLALTLVPKTFKSLRAIMPNTTIGSYMSYGLGEMMRLRLKREGYDIKTLQKRHRYLACSGSVHGLSVTADLSSASDSISVALVDRLFPADWLAILHKSRIGTVDLPDGTSIESKTFCTMGIGYTFPLQTLVFLALLKAIEFLDYEVSDRRTISVYGDDMIYSRRMHNTVVQVFEQLGFVINLDKTFHEGHFRESCGGDYFRGVDVRPFQPRNGSASVGKTAYEAILYKFANGLLARWSEYEIERTLGYLTSEMERVTGRCKIVPHDYPEDSGVRTPYPMLHEFLKHADISRPKVLGHGLYRFSYLSFKSELREETRHEPYLWIALSGRSEPVIDYTGFSSLRGAEDRVARRIDEQLVSSYEPPLILKDAHPISLTRSFSGRRLRRLSTYVTVSHTGRYTRQSGVSCF